MGPIFPGKRRKILIVASHPDDEVLGCGATAARLVREGHRLEILILGEGIFSRYSKRSEASTRRLVRLQENAKAVGALLGARSVRFERLPDNRFDELPILEIVKKVEKHIRRVRPEVVFTHHPGDLNVDHRATFRAVLTASRPVPGCPVKELYAFEVLSSTEWAFQQIQPAFKPDTFIEVSGTLGIKIRGMKRYRGESRSFPHPRSSEAIRSAARKWGSVVGVPAAEAFELVRAAR